LTLANLARRNGYTVGLLLVDIDNLRSINASWATKAAIACWPRCRQTMASLLRHSDVIGRYSGEAFAIFLSQVEPDALTSLAEHCGSPSSQSPTPARP
jgi:diguanylate cyclase (GGDEF)-like protein